MGVGRFFCVGLPLVLTIASIIALLVATLSGVTHNSLYIFRVNISDLSVNPSTLGNLDGLISNLKLNGRADLPTGNITAGNLGLNEAFDVTLWGFCTTSQDGKRECTKAQFDWASQELNTTWIENLGTVAGVKVKLPTEVQDGLNAFRTLVKWTEVAFIVALIALGVELVVGVFSNFSRVVSCLTWLTAGIAALLVGIAAGLATAMGTIVIGTFEAAARSYGVRGDVGGRFLAAAWIAFAFALGAAFFWLFTICCCKPEHRSRSGFRGTNNNRHSNDGEKLIPARGYAPLGNESHMSGAYGDANQQSQLNQPYSSQPPRYPGGTGRTDLAYEPYSHRA
ncbi:SUR7/PalI family protein [Hirsutella rhossiliensis]|uniref:SUR7/PalI family domain-containing protein n=1 Tax=Hirsutella rhossiliensis TaxID=111463 RepID=A0A9P8MWF5_9HYPO|nr:SUR7/PalI family domain-containing protein [Hirsutella rhossiliensis]KAH0962439.1 SUR7/PalI family domain-containing protein [Hirsutella rhossiliensis]